MYDQSCPTLCNLIDCSPPVSSVHGIPQARILEWVVIPFFRQCLYVESKKKKKKDDTNDLIHKTEIDPQTQKTNSWLKGKGMEGGINQEFGINKYTLLYIKQITNKDILYSTGNYTQYFVISCKRKVSENRYVCTYNSITLLYT